MKIKKFVPLFIFFFLIVFSAAAPARAQGETLFTVDDAGDSFDVNAGDRICADPNGRCTLRAAIQEAGTNNYQNVINFALPLPATINLTLGELTITSNLYIVGPGARNLTVQRSAAAGTPDFRVFRILPNVGSLLVMQAFTIKNGKVSGDGGGILNEAGNVVGLYDLAVSGNTATRGGGVANAGLLLMKRVLINSNSAVSSGGTNGTGGGFFNKEPFAGADIINSTLTENTAFAGGAVYNGARQMTVVNSTISHNNALTAGSSIVNAGEAMSFLNTIVGMDNSSNVGSLQGAFVSFGNNLITDARNSTGFTNGVNNDQVSDGNAIDALLGTLSDNGGQTDTRPLLAGSPAINAGNNCVYYANCPLPFTPSFYLSTDQRLSHLRLGGAIVDIGAFEFQTASFNANIALGTFSIRNRAGGTLLTLTKADTNAKQSRITNPFGNFRFVDLNFGASYILERKPKRSNERAGVFVFTFDSLPPPNTPPVDVERDGFKITFSK